MGATSALREEEGKGEPRIVGVCGGGATPDHQPAAAYPSAKRRVAGRRAHEPAVLPNGTWGHCARRGRGFMGGFWWTCASAGFWGLFVHPRPICTCAPVHAPVCSSMCFVGEEDVSRFAD